MPPTGSAHRSESTIALLAAGGLAIAFAAATWVYQSQRDEKVARLAKQYNAAPFVREHAQTLGSDDVRVVLVEFFDPGCETCRAFNQPVKDMVESSDGRARLVLRYAPFHAGADTVVKILEAARRQGKYWETLQLMYDKQPEWADHHHPNPDAVWPFLPELGLDVDRLRVDMRDPEVKQLLWQDMTDAQTLGVRRTPTFFVNGKPLQRFGIGELEQLVRQEIDAAYGS